MKKLSSEYKSWFGEYPQIVNSLNLGATNEEINELEIAFGLTLPIELRKILSDNNGQDNEEVGILVAYCMLSTHDIIETWKIMNSLLERNEFDDFESVEAIGPVKSEAWWNPKWIPFAESTSGDLLCIDLDQENGGDVGQIIIFWHDWGQRKVVAPHLKYFIKNTLNTLTSNEYQGRMNEIDEIFEIEGFLV